MTQSPQPTTATASRTGFAWFLAIGGLLVATVLFFHPFFFGDKVISANDIAYTLPPFDQLAPDDFSGPHNPLLADQVQQFHVYRHIHLSAIRQGIWPRWFPHILSGNSWTGNTQSQSWYPLTYLGLLRPLPVAETWTKVIETVLAALGMMLFLRRSSGMSAPLAWLGGLAFAFCAYRIVWLNHPHSSSITYLPWILWSIRGLADASRSASRWAAACALSVFLAIAGGHPQTFILVLTGAGLFGLHTFFPRVRQSGERRQSATRLLWWIGAMGLGITGAAVILLPFADALFTDSFTYGDRAGFATRGILPGRAFWPLLVPDIFGNPITGNDTNLYNYNENALFLGVTTLWLGLAGLPWACRQRDVRFLLGLAVVVIAVLCGVPYLSPWVRGLPIVRDMPILRTTLLLQFSLAALGALGASALFQRLRLPASPLLKGWLALTAAFLAILLFMASFHCSFAVMFPAVGAAFTVLIFTLFVIKRPRHALAIWTWIFPVIVFVELFVAFARYNPAIPSRIAILPEPETIRAMHQAEGTTWFRVVGLDGTLSPNLGALFDVRDIRGYDLPMSQRYVDFLRHAFYGGTWRYGMIYWQAGGFDLFAETNRPLLAMMGIRYALVEGRAVRIPESLVRPYPYAYVASEVLPATADRSNDVEILREGRHHLAEAPAAFIPLGPRTGTLILRERSINRVALIATLPEPALIAINEMPLKGWKATVNGRRADVFPVNMIHTGVYVPAGEHRIDFNYFPTSFQAGLALSGAAWLVIVILLLMFRHDRHKP